MLYITIQERFKDAKVHAFKVIDSNDIEDSTDIIPHLAGIDHKRFKVDVVDKNGVPQWDYTTEWCSYCGKEVDIAPFGLSYCPNCGERILPCSMCDAFKVGCDRCPYENK